jgi:pseudouridine kinase
METIFIIGGAAIDITGKPDSVCRERDSNIGKIRIRVGGVGHNLAVRLRNYAYPVELVTAIGSGYHASMVRESCEAAGVSLQYTLSGGEHTGTYIGVFDEDGDMLVGISDMSVLARLTPAYLSGLLPQINASAMCVLDGNLSPEALNFLCANVTAPLFYDPVSCAKAARIGPNIGKCCAIKPNRTEAGFLSGKSCHTVRGVYRAADWFLEQGVEHVFISLGEEGVYWADQSGCGLLPAGYPEAANADGAGDAMGAAIIDGFIRKRSTEECAVLGNEASARVCAENS